MLSRIELQNFLFNQKPTRIQLLHYENKSLNKKRVHVYRNHSFELIANTMSAYLDYANLEIEFSYSDYDDSLSFHNFDDTIDSVLLWIDAARYQINTDLSSFLVSRVTDLRKFYSNPIILGVIGSDIKIDFSDVLNIDFLPLKKDLKEKFYDERMESFAGTKLSQQTCLKLTELFGLKIFPAVLKPIMKAIFVDLDNTLYKGVLGENGIYGLILTEGHKRLQEKLKSLSQEGFFLCAISKNDQSDVEKLFRERDDFPLKINDFAKIFASWQEKSKNIKNAAKSLNITLGVGETLFIDDNIGEISEVSSSLPTVNYILANDDAHKTAEILSKQPGFIRFRITKEDDLRKNDVLANEERQKLQSALSHEDFLRQLKITVRIFCNDNNGKDRIAQLANKTNQFIFAYKRYTVVDIDRLMNDSNAVIVSLHLKDTLSDSGMIGAIILKKDNNIGILEDCFISCRALGRGIDNLIIFEAIKTGLNHIQVKNLLVHFILGERNEPAKNFVEQYLKPYLSSPSPFQPNPSTDLVTFIHEDIS